MPVKPLPGRIVFGEREPGGIGADEFRRLARECDGGEVRVMLQNPSAGAVLRALYLRKPPFDDLPSERLRALVDVSSKNPRINIDESNEHGPDLLAWDIHKGIFELLQVSPVEREWLQVLHQLLLRLDPARSRVPSEGEAIAVLSRWRALKVKKTFGNKDEDEEGWYTSLPFPPRQNSCRLHRPTQGAPMKDGLGSIRTDIQGQGGGAVAAAGERSDRRGCARGWDRDGHLGALARGCAVQARPRAGLDRGWPA